VHRLAVVRIEVGVGLIDTLANRVANDNGAKGRFQWFVEIHLNLSGRCRNGTAGRRRGIAKLRVRRRWRGFRQYKQ
jgi:hypothetical protein